MSNSNDPRSWFDGMLSACFSVILALVGLYWAASLIESVWPTLVVILSVLGLVAGLVVAVRWWRNSRF
ncbi:hypothetical protein ACTXJR_09970 [Glutamicibacter ardleyensis]|uniref:hypothetical protein n=1 Tax=Glutamicibacter TaxID=1742989 RepID=UPI003FD033DE